ncbi:MAG: FGGY-family carbohydrate kinase [Oscillospiraceae bacterium]|nr:FGGY-family carbohydrate kinase [Oscillospiraceae bacterium]
MSKFFMGIDIGTFGSKGTLVNENAEIIAERSEEHQMEVPHPGYAEHDAEKTWWGDFCRISNELISSSGIDPKDIVSVGCSTIGPCCLPVDENLNPLRKAILYGIDVRAVKEIEYLENLYGKSEIFEKCGTPLTSQSAAAKILWIKNNEPEVYAGAYKFVTGSTYLVAKLTGKCVIDNYTAATWVPIYSMEKLDWVDDVSLFCRRDQLPECRWSSEIVGEVTEKAAKETGLAAGTKVTAGTADASAEAFSVGVLDPGDMMLMYGSSIFIIHVVEKFTKDARLWAGPYLFPGTYSVAAGMSCAGTLTHWFRDNFAIDIMEESKKSGKNVFCEMAKFSEGIPAGSEGLVILPYFSGERTPINDPLAKGMIFGLNLQHTRAHIYKALLEGVGYGINQHFEIFDALGMGTKKVMAVGGGTRNPAWLKAVSDISGKRQFVAETDTGAAYGDALIAALGVGHFASSQAVADTIKIKSLIAPDKDTYADYAPYRDRYNKLYQQTKDIMHNY